MGIRQSANQRSAASLAALPTAHLATAHDLRQQIVREAREWIGTPYHHQASVKGVGCDCIGLIRGVWRAAIGPEPEAMPAYSRDWGEAAGAEHLMALGERYFTPVAVAAMAPGDVVVFRMRERRIAKHCGILTDGGSRQMGNRQSASAADLPTAEVAIAFIHAQERVPVAEVAMSGWWRRRIIGAFRFPGAGNRQVGNGQSGLATADLPTAPGAERG